jgi:predicted nucleotidyltransferase
MGTVVPSLDGRVLQALAGSTAPLPLTHVHRLSASGSLSGVRKVLVRLVGTGLVETVPGGYLLNREHVAAPAVELLAGLRREVLRRLTDRVGLMDPPPLLAGVFGSFARGDGDGDSDIDVLLVVPSQARPLAAETPIHDPAVDVATAVRTWTGNTCHVVVVTPADLERMRSHDEPVLVSWNEDLIALAGDRRVLAP